jgi:UDP-N-acetylglucosamine 2-epimerase
MLESIEQVLIEERPDRVLVYGDTNSTLAGALAAAKLHIPAAHVEAGLRSFNRRMPEEINRLVTDHIADLLFCPTKTAVENLRQEGVLRGIHQVGDVMYDCVLTFAPIAEQNSKILRELNLKPKGYFLATIHRAENTDDPARLKSLLDALFEINRRLGTVVWPVHPRTRKAMATHRLEKGDSLTLTAPLPYIDFQCLLANARCVLTDSGGLQKEAFFHKIPCLTLRDETEWVETTQHNCNRIVGTDAGKVIEAAEKACFSNGTMIPNLYGDGKASSRIVEVLIGQ